jgi:membrane-bound metal-dependent hydrolase YbcI (DUF457 family)
MLGKSHALSGAVGWLAGCALLAELGHHPSGVTTWVGAAVSTGMALLPDLDHPGSTVARTLGPATRLLSTGVAKVAAHARGLSCDHCLAAPDRGGHRGLTHTALGALFAGVLVALGGWRLGQTFALIVVGFAVWLGTHAALSSKWRAKIGDMVLPGRFRRRGKSAFRFTAGIGALLVAGVAVGALHSEAPTGGWWWIGLPVAWGCLAHSLGDAMTFSAVPLWWPLEVRGCRWTNVGTPRWMRFRTGSRVETFVVLLMGAAGIGAMYVLGSVPA